MFIEFTIARTTGSTPYDTWSVQNINDILWLDWFKRTLHPLPSEGADSEKP